MRIIVDKYRIVWSNRGTSYGAVDIRDNAGNQFRLRSNDPALLTFWTDVLRNEEPVYFNSTSEVLYTGPEEPGEEES